MPAGRCHAVPRRALGRRSGRRGRRHACRPTCGTSRATSSARRSRPATSRRRRPTAGPPTARGTWSTSGKQGQTVATALFRLRRTVLGATVEKRLTLRRNHPFLYETHTFLGGEGAVPVANHAMAALPEGGRLAFSAKRGSKRPRRRSSPTRPRGARCWPTRRTTADPTRVAAARRVGSRTSPAMPFAERHEDFAMLVEAPRTRRLGWCAASRPATRDAMLSLKNPRELPVTFLWWSNGGRDYSPWNGRHTGVLGIEEGRSNSLVRPSGLRSRQTRCPRAGIPTALDLDAAAAAVAVRNVIGAVALPDGGDSGRGRYRPRAARASGPLRGWEHRSAARVRSSSDFLAGA